MSVAVPIIDSINGVTRRIYLKSGVSSYHPIDDLYKEYRNLRRLDESIRKYEPLLIASGNVNKGGGKATPRYVTLLDGTKVVPFDENGTITQTGEMITDDPDLDATLYDLSGFVSPIKIFITPSEAEVILVNPGFTSADRTTLDATLSEERFKRLNFNKTNTVVSEKVTKYRPNNEFDVDVTYDIDDVPTDETADL